MERLITWWLVLELVEPSVESVARSANCRQAQKSWLWIPREVYLPNPRKSTIRQYSFTMSRALGNMQIRFEIVANRQRQLIVTQFVLIIRRYDFIPTVLDRNIVDAWIKTKDKESFHLARELIKEEGLLCGGSSGAALSAALNVAKDLPADKRVVVLLPDGIRNYMTKFVADLWMESRNFLV